jgi:phosphohistidine phosphatase
MKTLLLMRHAKSGWKEKNTQDHERPLNKRGRRDAPRMGTQLKDRELIPQLILCSSALRARQTAELVAEAAGYTDEIIYLDELYMSEVDENLNALRELPDSIERVMLIGHNPGLETMLQILSNRIESLPTAVIAHIVLPITHWRLLDSDVEGELVEIWRPKELIEEPEEGSKETKAKKEQSKDKGKKKK